MSDIRIDKYLDGRIQELSDFIRIVFDEFVGLDYSAEGNKVFYEFISPENLAKRLAVGNLLITAQENGEIIGMIEVRDNIHICLFFVDKEYQGRGIGRNLFEAALKQIGNKTDYIDVNASPYSEPIYAALGFEKTGELREVDGIKFIPMKIALPNKL